MFYNQPDVVPYHYCYVIVTKLSIHEICHLKHRVNVSWQTFVFKLSLYIWKLSSDVEKQFKMSYLTMCINYRSQQLPGPPPAVHAHHAQDLKETKATQRRGGKDVTLATCWNHGNRGDEYNDVWGVKEGKLKVTGSTILAGTVVDALTF